MVLAISRRIVAIWPLATQPKVPDHVSVHAQIVLFDGFDPLDVIAPFEVLAAGSDVVGGELMVELVSADGPGPVVSGSRGIALNATAPLDPSKPGIVIVPGAVGPIEGDPDDGVVTIPVLLARFGETAAIPLVREALANPDRFAPLRHAARQVALDRYDQRHLLPRMVEFVESHGRDA